MLPSGCATRSFGEFKDLPSKESAITVIVPSCSQRTTRRKKSSVDSWRPWKSKQLPLLLFDGFRKVVTRRLSHSNRYCVLPCTSLNRKYWPSLDQAGPSV